MEPRQQGLLDKEPLKEVDEDMVSEVDLNNTVTEEEREEMENELIKLEEEITTLKQVLASKENRHLELKQKLGITPLNELRQNFSKSWYDMQTSTALLPSQCDPYLPQFTFTQTNNDFLRHTTHLHDNNVIATRVAAHLSFSLYAHTQDN